MSDYTLRKSKFFILKSILFLCSFWVHSIVDGQVFPPPETGIEWLFISGSDADYDLGDDDHIQTAYLLIPDSIDTPFKIEIIIKDYKTQTVEEARKVEGKFEFRLFGRRNVYPSLEFNKYIQETADYSLTLSNMGDRNILSEEIDPRFGEYRKEIGSWLFRIEMEGLEGEAYMHYKLILRPENIYNSNYSGSYIYSNNLSFLLPENDIRLSFFIPDSAAGLSFEFFDMDLDGDISFISKRRKAQKAFPSDNSEYRRAMLNIFSDEKNDSISLIIKDVKKTDNNISLYWLLEDAKGKDISLPFDYSAIPNNKRKKKKFK